MVEQLDELWNECVDGDREGDGARKMFVLINFHGLFSGGGLLHAVESVKEDEEDGDPYYRMSEMYDALEWAGLPQIAAHVRGVEASMAETDEDALDALEEQADEPFDAAVSEESLTELLRAKYTENPAAFR